MSEFNCGNQSLEATQACFKQSIEYLDRVPEVERYALFGAFRSDVSNVGPNATILNDEGKLTDIGLWYLDRKGVGAQPLTKLKSGSQGPSTVAGGFFQIVVSSLAVTVVLMFL